MLYCLSLCTDTATCIGMCQGVSLKVVGWGTASRRGRKAWSKEELDIYVSVHVRVVDGPHCMLRSLALILNSCQSGSHPVRGLSHWDTLHRDLHNHQSQQGGGNAV